MTVTADSQVDWDGVKVWKILSKFPFLCNVLFKMCLVWDQQVYKWICELQELQVVPQGIKYTIDCKKDKLKECEPFVYGTWGFLPTLDSGKTLLEQIAFFGFSSAPTEW